jgi:hypothetical protein
VEVFLKGKYHFGIILLTAILLSALFLLAAYRMSGIGFPLDDGWIHQTYARNLAYRGEWSYVPGFPSAGSTSPLWTFWLAGGYLLHLGPFAWTFISGALCLSATALLGGVWGKQNLQRDEKSKASFAFWAGLFLVGEWHLVWASMSGMETILYAAAICTFFVLLKQYENNTQGNAYFWGASALIGAAIWIRPDAITLLGPLYFVLLLQGRQTLKKRAVQLLGSLVILLLFTGAYAGFNARFSGNWWPNTFYAKQAEYAVLQQIPLVNRYFKLLALPLIGPGVLLLPGMFYGVWQAWKQKNGINLAAVIWWLGYTLIYAVRLPVDYQHGRYLIPAMPVYFILGLSGLNELLKRLPWSKPAGRVFRRAVPLMVGLTWLGFLGIGLGAYAQDVAVIQTEMVVSAKWIAANTPQDSLIAAHDIGALGYFGERKILDLAGLISPDVIPFIRDEEQLQKYMDSKKVDYLLTFPGWYPTLTTGLMPEFSSGGKVAPLLGEENMVIYRWRNP